MLLHGARFVCLMCGTMTVCCRLCAWISWESMEMFEQRIAVLKCLLTRPRAMASVLSQLAGATPISDVAKASCMLLLACAPLMHIDIESSKADIRTVRVGVVSCLVVS
jgi:hypothetical protein